MLGFCRQVSKDGFVTTSTLPFRPDTRDHGRQLVCRAENGHVTPPVLEARRALDVRCTYVCSGSFSWYPAPHRAIDLLEFEFPQ